MSASLATSPAANTISTTLFDVSDVGEALASIRMPVAVVGSAQGPRPVLLGPDGLTPDILRQELIAVLPPIYPEWLGERSFTAAHGVRFPYVIGEMARGIATARMTIEGVRAGGMAFFGSAGLGLDAIEAGVREIQAALGPESGGWGANLIHNVQDDRLELATIELFHRLGVRCVSASAFMRLTPAIVLYAAKGLRRGADGQVVRAGRIFAKVSRDEVARHFLSPAPEAMLSALVAEGRITAAEAALAAEIPIAEDITAEADSGGHTDNRALTVLLPRLLGLRDEIAAAHGYAVLPRVGAAGGLGTPAAVAAAFAAGAAYVLTGSVNQSAVESGLSPDARNLLAVAQSTDVAMAPAADMFEMGVTVQVLKRGTMFAQRGQRLADFYRRYSSFEEAPARELESLETTVLGRRVDEIWSDTEAFFAGSDPRQVERARQEPKHRMALVFRWYLFNGAQWAREGNADRRGDYQIWCGPAMGAFNEWVRGTFLDPVEARTVRQIALNLLEGAATVTRAGQLRAVGVAMPASAFDFRPRPLG
ncbi:PfaD family polyunsaturated fatty acid/polyketide biosynthesis protein [Mycobacterium sp. TNTM28]|uniref:PfaD family polyunsaturated fatty acid/polyketide biosynthesis protein n=1 Tax=[Mycobacterium] fortunisiensis TaxID=2600579 RepID=A0ABS6KHP2_9MYCO|nr:PfaD family polyunsaturated fatty acid/polyketide biosynthesis protein [[Mycobacterium] fortunisiensis]MBU9763079.1 PfaD family polyunsaturated fatty acid/polyketide biosynthesis protein [[Mycobacterium] fortunisiensis]